MSSESVVISDEELDGEATSDYENMKLYKIPDQTKDVKAYNWRKRGENIVKYKKTNIKVLKEYFYCTFEGCKAKKDVFHLEDRLKSKAIGFHNHLPPQVNEKLTSEMRTKLIKRAAKGKKARELHKQSLLE